MLSALLLHAKVILVHKPYAHGFCTRRFSVFQRFDAHYDAAYAEAARCGKSSALFETLCCLWTFCFNPFKFLISFALSWLAHHRILYKIFAKFALFFFF